MAAGEIIFGTKIESIVNGNFIVYNLKDHEDTHKMFTRAIFVQGFRAGKN